MQKLWSSKNKRSQPDTPEVTENKSDNKSENKDISSLSEVSEEDGTTEDLSQEEDVAESSEKLSSKRQISSFWLFLGIGIGGVLAVAIFGLQYLTTPESSTDSQLICNSQVSGDWQTPFGKVNLQVQNNDLVSGKYEYVNFERGKVVGELSGKLSNNIVTFNWQETPTQQPKQQGKGVLVFKQGCKEFYGSYGLNENTSNFGNWQGSQLNK